MANGVKPRRPAWYPRNVVEIRSDPRRRFLSFEAAAVLTLCEDEQCVSGSIPSDPDTLARWIQVDPSIVRRAMPEIEPLFNFGDDGTMFIPAAAEWRERVLSTLAAQSEGGRRAQAKRREAAANGPVKRKLKSTPMSTSKSTLKSTSTRLQPKPNQLFTADRFDEFWSIHPRKCDKKTARKAWDRVKPDDATVDLMLANISRRIELGWWVKGNERHMLHPTTFLNNERWNDEITPMTGPPASRPAAVRPTQHGFIEHAAGIEPAGEFEDDMKGVSW